MKKLWLLLSLLGILLTCSPAEAARLVFWRFERGQNRLVFTTDTQVRPQAQLISDPTRLVIDLPGVRLGRPSASQRVGGAIANIRVGQFNSTTTRLVVELAPGYTMDPQAVSFQGSSPREWSVQLPTPRLITESSGGEGLPKFPRSNGASEGSENPTLAASSPFRVTRNGFFVRLGDNANGRVRVQRSREGQVEINLDGINLPDDLKSKRFSVGTYGVETVTFTQESASRALITMAVSENTTDWQASLSRYGGLAIVPGEGSIIRGSNGNITLTPPTTVADNGSDQGQAEDLAVIQSVEVGLGNQILIRSNRPIEPSLSSNRSSGVYQLKIPNAQLADDLQGGNLPSRAANLLSQMRIRQYNQEGSVEILFRTVNGVEVGELNQLSSTVVALTLQRQSDTSSRNPSQVNIPVPLPPRRTPSERTPLPPRNPQPTGDLPDVSNSRVLVVIDPGHGGKDPGAIGIGGLQEKNVVLPISLQVSRLLEQQGVRVMMTRDRDYFVSLAGRTQMANGARANVFVSIHANAISMSRPDVNGVETYYYSSQGRVLAQTIHNSIMRSIRIGNRGVKHGRFYVLRNSAMPASLVEVGFVTGRADAPRLADPNFRSQMAEAIARGILEYVQRRY
ncbi:N-acetylmuramoyl-L-alanine amidase [Spirulina sp. CS-785/01]|uniref:N-acetylmuramoyl-L-alanine amidase n=1 Tax=Spirulina sp. CS-785/01 TaxID=3021716 RepID=UPI00232FD420|nr:N-acetylmuramoyl-L-alanine amidase [Spirulina sp. CS-785/01]MDB9313134.1 N-acetylmuramoyl-L-alanine amidase [Spirulina sp. CS-785/01]